MDFTSKKYDDNLVYIFVGEFSAGNWTAAFYQDIGDKSKEGIQRFIFDFGQVTYINSSGIGVLNKAARLISGNQCSIALVNLPPFVMKILYQLSLLSVFPILKSLDEVVNPKAPADNSEPKQA